MLELPVAASGSFKIPAVLVQQANDFADLHVIPDYPNGQE